MCSVLCPAIFHNDKIWNKHMPLNNDPITKYTMLLKHQPHTHVKTTEFALECVFLSYFTIKEWKKTTIRTRQAGTF